MKGIIWYYTDRQKAIDKLITLANNYKKMNVEGEIINTDRECFIKLNNGDFWSVVSVENGLSRRSNIALIEKGTPQELIDTFIKPCNTLIPYTAYNYWE